MAQESTRTCFYSGPWIYTYIYTTHNKLRNK